MQRGTVKFYNDDKGFGFIRPENGGKDIFVHASKIAGEGIKTLDKGVPVEFEVCESKRGVQAINVRALPKRPAANGTSRIANTPQSKLSRVLAA